MLREVVVEKARETVQGEGGAVEGDEESRGVVYAGRKEGWNREGVCVSEGGEVGEGVFLAAAEAAQLGEPALRSVGGGDGGSLRTLRVPREGWLAGNVR